MSVTIGPITFDSVRYDADADVLYLHIGDPSTAVDFDETPEGHAVRFDGNGRVVGLTLVGVAGLLDRDGDLYVTLPSTERVAADALRAALGRSAGGVRSVRARPGAA